MHKQPLAEKSKLLPGEFAFEYGAFDIDGDFKVAIASMEMRRIMVVVQHCDDNAEKAGNLRYGIPPKELRHPFPGLLSENQEFQELLAEHDHRGLTPYRDTSARRIYTIHHRVHRAKPNEVLGKRRERARRRRKREEARGEGKGKGIRYRLSLTQHRLSPSWH
jgi:hypothetical protein